MPRKFALLAKLARPSARGLLVRPRLLKLLDRSARSARAIWVNAPGGAGKTTLISSWIEQRKLKCLWYQLDAGDADPATFFHYLGEAAKFAPRGRNRPLPHLTPEYALGLDVFVRRFFESLFARYPAPFVLVLDNYQEAAADTKLHTIMSAALASAPEGSRIVFLSRGDAPPSFARWQTGGQWVNLSWDDIRLTDGEARALAKAMPYGVPRDVAAMNLRARGWVAGLILLLRGRAEGAGTPASLGEGARPVFDYFATEVYAATSYGLREFLMTTALLPYVTPALAAAVTGRENAGELLAELFRNRTFIDRRAGGSVVYEYHPLFREFLQARAAEHFGAEALEALARAAGRALEEGGQIESAFDLYARGAEWSEVVRLILTQAPGFMAQGRLQLLETWIARVPVSIQDSMPWLTFWQGTCGVFANPAAGRGLLEQAYARFKAAGDRAGCLMTWAGISESYFLEFNRFDGMDPWITEIEQLLPTFSEFPDLMVEARVLAGATGMAFRRPQHPAIRLWTTRALELIPRLADPGLRIGIASFATMVFIWRGDIEHGLQAWALTGVDAESPDTPPLHSIFLNINVAGLLWQRAEHDKAIRALEEVQRISDSTGVRILDLFSHAHMIYALLSVGDTAVAARHADLVDRLVVPSRSLEASHVRFMRAGVLFLKGDVREALAIAESELPMVVSAGCPFGTATMRIQTAQMLILVGRHAEARELLRLVCEFSRELGSDILVFQAQMNWAWSLFETGEDAVALETLREALTIGARRNYMNCHPWWQTRVMSDLCGLALEAGVETDYVIRLIRRRGIPPGRYSGESWPWPIRIYVLGRFDLIRNGESVKSGGKAQRRVLDLLKGVIASGSRAVPIEGVAAALWPDAEGDAAKEAFDVTLHRLRRLLGEEQAVTVSGAKVSINTDVCWVDALAFERAVDAMDMDSTRAADEALQLYCGTFLRSDGDRPWLLAHRERLHSKFLRCMDRHGVAREQGGDREGAIELYRRVIELDPLAERFYRRLMESYVRQDRRAEALETYRRCRQMLSLILGVGPSAETEAIRKTLVDATGERSTSR